MNAKYSGEAMTPFLTHSAMPAARCRRSSVRRWRTSEMTPTGCWKAPSRFFATGWLTATLPPSAPSTMASSVVGRLTYGTPRMYALATQPPRSLMTPPPNVSTRSRRARPVCASQFHIPTAVASDFVRSPAGTARATTSTPCSRRERSSAAPCSASTVVSVISATVATPSRKPARRRCMASASRTTCTT